MCQSNHFMEQGTYLIYNKIKQESMYEILCLEIGGKQFRYQDVLSSEKYNSPQYEGLLTKIHLRDTDGEIYIIEPSMNGLNFAKGEISYFEYQKQRKKAEILSFCLYGGVVSVLFTVGFLFKLFYI